ncbi:MAG: hypothetical protein K0R05_2108 [Anaerocolumna sp.]|jgi:hypothetical protein|nr:hypothetical protein [Anaerocolumna sp.]
MRLFMLREIYDITQNKYLYFTCFNFCKDNLELLVKPLNQ